MQGGRGRSNVRASGKTLHKDNDACGGLDARRPFDLLTRRCCLGGRILEAVASLQQACGGSAENPRHHEEEHGEHGDTTGMADARRGVPSQHSVLLKGRDVEAINVYARPCMPITYHLRLGARWRSCQPVPQE